MSVFVSETRTPQLIILSGVHKGAAVPLEANAAYRLGADVACDIVLRDAGIASHHVTLNIAEGELSLASHADLVQTDRKLKILDGHVCESRLPLSFSIGDTRMQVAYSRDGHASRSSAVSSRLKVLLPAMVGISVVLGYMLWYPVGVASEANAQASLNALAEPAKKLPIDLVRRQLESRLKASGLGQLQVRAGQSQMEVSGELPVDTRAQWHEIQMWFDRAYGKDYLLRSKLTEAQAVRMAIQAVWTGASPYIIDGQGQRRYPGSVVEDGWVLEKIDRHEVVLVKNGQQHIFRL
ncbi:hypothetical protein BOTU111921_10840 [Bordetella tumbae]